MTKFTTQLITDRSAGGEIVETVENPPLGGRQSSTSGHVELMK